MSEDEEQAWLDDGIGQPPSRDPAVEISRCAFWFGYVVLGALVLWAVVSTL